MEYRFDFKKVRKPYRKRNSPYTEPIQEAKKWELREKHIRMILDFLSSWFKGRIISNEMALIMQKLGVLHLVRNNKIEEARKLLLNS